MMSCFFDFMSNEMDCQSCSFQNEQIIDQDIRFMTVYDCQFTNVIFDHCIFEQVNFSRCKFINCKFLNSSYFECVMKSNFFLESDFIGIKMSQSNLEQNHYEKVLWKYGEMRKNTFQNEMYEECSFLSISIDNNQFFDDEFSSCHFVDAHLQSTFQDVSFLTSSLENTFLDINQLKNCKLTPSQGLELLSFYGITF